MSPGSRNLRKSSLTPISCPYGALPRDAGGGGERFAQPASRKDFPGTGPRLPPVPDATSLDMMQLHQVGPPGLTDPSARQDHDPLPRFHEPFRLQATLRFVYALVRLEDLLHRMWNHSPVQRHLPAYSLIWRERDDRSDRALLRDQAGRCAQLAEGHDRAAGGCGDRPRGSAADGLREGDLAVADIRPTLGPWFNPFLRCPDDPIHDAHRFHRIAPDRRFG